MGLDGWSDEGRDITVDDNGDIYHNNIDANYT